MHLFVFHLDEAYGVDEGVILGFGFFDVVVEFVTVSLEFFFFLRRFDDVVCLKMKRFIFGPQDSSF